MYRVCSRHAELEVLHELCPKCGLILFDEEGYDTLSEIVAAARAAPKLDKPQPRDFIDRWVSEKPKKK